MHDNRDPTKCKCKTKAVDIVSVILTIAIAVMSIGLLGSIFEPSGSSGGGYVKVEGAVGGSVTVGGEYDTDNNKTETDTNTDTDSDTENETENNAGTETDTENNTNNEADTDTDSGNNETETDTESGTDSETEETINLLYDFSSGGGDGLTYSENVDTYDYLSVETVALDGNSVLSVAKSAYSASSEVVWLALNEDTEDNTYIFETDFMWSGCQNGVSGETDPTWYYRFSLSNASGTGNTEFLNLWFCSQAGESAVAIVGSTSATTSDYLTVLNTNQWYHLTIRYNIDTDTATIFIDENAIGFVDSVAPNNDDVCGAFEIENRGKVRDSIIYVDNVTVTTTNE